MITNWKSQQGNGNFALQFETDDRNKYELVEKAAQMAIDGKSAADIAEVKHEEWEVTEYKEHFNVVCSNCKKDFYVYKRGQYRIQISNYCPNCGAKMDGKDGSK